MLINYRVKTAINHDFALKIAFQKPDEDAMRLLIAEGASMNEQYKKHSRRMTILHETSAVCRESVARMLIQEGAIVDSFSLDYGTPPIVALWIGNEAVARLLIEKGADINFNKDERFDLCSSWTFPERPEVPFGFRPPGTCPASEICFSAQTIVQQRSHD